MALAVLRRQVHRESYQSRQRGMASKTQDIKEVWEGFYQRVGERFSSRYLAAVNLTRSAGKGIGKGCASVISHNKKSTIAE